MTPLDAAGLALKASLPILLALLFARTLGRRRPEAAHLGLTLAFLAALLIPLAAWLLPAWRVPLLPRAASLPMALEEPKSRKPLAASPEAPPSPAQKAMVPISAVKDEPLAASTNPRDASHLLLATWSLGVGFVLLRAALGGLALRRLRRGSLPLPLRPDLAARAGLDRPWELRRCPPGGPASALTWGTVRPVVLLPADSVGWTPARMESVLLHELAHARRGDALVGLVAEIACALHWFNPLMRLGARALREASEGSADRAVLRCGVRPADYAADLLALAASPRQRFRLAGVQAMNSTKLEPRLRAVLASDASARVPSKRAALLVALSVLAMVPALAAFRPAPGEDRSAQERDQALWRAKNLGTATILYVQDWDGRLPTGRSTATVASQVLPYARANARESRLARGNPGYNRPPMSDVQIFQSPTSGGRFLYNPRLAGASLTAIESLSETPAWYESLPDAGMDFVVAYVDGHVKLLSSAERPKFLRAWSKAYPRGTGRFVRRDPGLATPAPMPSSAQRLAQAKARLAAAQAEFVRARNEVADLLKSSQAATADAGARLTDVVRAKEARLRALDADVMRREREVQGDRARRKSLEMERQRLQSWQDALRAQRRALEAGKTKP